MKIWIGFGSEHSANLVVIGKFESDAKAQEAFDLLKEATDVARSEESAGRIKLGEPSHEIPRAILDLAVQKNLALGYNDPQELVYHYRALRDGDKVVIRTDETEVNAFVKVLLRFSGKIEVYSAHDFPNSPYGHLIPG